jgi:hypothetical protein
MILYNQQYRSRPPQTGVQKGGCPLEVLQNIDLALAKLPPSHGPWTEEHVPEQQGQSCLVLGSGNVLNSPKNI